MKLMKKNPEADLSLKYRKVLEASLAISILIMVVSFFSFKKFEAAFELPEQPDLVIESIDIPQTKQLQKPPPPSRPSIPVEVDDDEAMDDVTIEDTDVAFEDFQDAAPPPPPEEDEEVYEFFAVSEKPQLLHKEVPKFPDLARKAGIEGTVVVTVTISKKGDVIDARIFKSVPMLDESALDAAKKCKFKPAKQRDKFVKVKMNIPFQFKLK